MMKLKEGMIVEHPVMHEEWGPGKIISVDGEKVHVVFRDISEPAAKVLHTGTIDLRISANQNDPILVNVPPLKEVDGKYLFSQKRITVKHAVKMFMDLFPEGFYDPEYLGDKKSVERGCKAAAHQEWVKLLGDGQAENLLNSDINELSSRVLQIILKNNLLLRNEKIAFKDALQDQESATQFLTALVKMLDEKDITRKTADPYFQAVGNLYQEKGKSTVTTWPVATILLFLAQPERHMFLKPVITKNAAETLGFDLHYNAAPNWTTYDALLRMSKVYKEELKDLEPRDYIDIQSFFWVAAGKK